MESAEAQSTGELVLSTDANQAEGLHAQADSKPITTFHQVGSDAMHSNLLAADHQLDNTGRLAAPVIAASPMHGVAATGSTAQGAPAAPATPQRCQPMPFSPMLQLPTPDSNGATVGIPMPLQGLRRGTSGASTLPPMPGASVQAPVYPPAADAADSTVPGKWPTPASQFKGAAPSRSSKAQYCQVLVPTTVYQGGVTRQLLVPMMCMVAPNAGAGGSPLQCTPVSARALQPRTANANAAGTLAKAVQPRKAAALSSAKHSRESSPLGVAHGSVQKTTAPLGSGSRLSMLSSGPHPVAAQQTDASVAKDEGGALDVLADAAMLEMA